MAHILRLSIFFILGFFVSVVSAEIKIVLTAALVDGHYEFRKNQYIESFNRLKMYGYKNFYIVESIKKAPTFLEDYTNNVFYSQANDPIVPPGLNEARTLLDALYYFGFDDEDIIIKLTGRHQFISDIFLKQVENNPEINLFVKKRGGDAIYTIAFAMRCKYLKKMLEGLDYNLMLAPFFYDLETVINLFVKDKKWNGILYVDTLGVKANVFGSTTAPEMDNIYFF